MFGRKLIAGVNYITPDDRCNGLAPPLINLLFL